MNILLMQLDGKLPNVALMRLSHHHRELGDYVELRRCSGPRSVQPHFQDRFERIYASLIFEKSRPTADALVEVRPDAIIGGTGWKEATTLESIGVQTLQQDYTIYHDFQASIGFTQRGCRLRCPFCVVPAKEGRNRQEQTVAELYRGDPWPRHLLLLDNDFFGQPAWRERIAEMRDGQFKVSFTRGVNARLIRDEEAAAIASVDYRDDAMKVKRIYTAWDNRKDEDKLFRGLEALRNAGVKPDHIMVYLLCGYWPDETHEDRDYRRAKLREFGCRPYPMPFVRTPEIVGFQRWVIGAYDKTVSWQDWVRARYEPRKLRLRDDTRQQALHFRGDEP